MAYANSGILWTPKAHIIHSRSYAGIVALNGKIYVFGGNDPCSPYGEKPNLYEYDIASDTWTAKADMLNSSTTGMGAVAFGGKVYSIGGAYGLGGALSAVEVYDPGSNNWTYKGNLPAARGYTAAAVANGKIYLMGGTVSGVSYADRKSVV